MKHGAASLLLVLGLSWTAGAGAQLYKSVGPDGKVTYSDLPPASATHVEKQSARFGPAEALPPELAEAVKNHPVTLYTTEKCQPCDEGRKLLAERGIPYAEKTVQSDADLAILRQAGGDQQLPLLTVGTQKQHGFEAGAWHAALSAARYPASSRLPKSYRNPPAVAAAPKKPVEPAHAATSEPASPAQAESRPATPASTTPPGFRF